MFNCGPREARRPPDLKKNQALAQETPSTRGLIVGERADRGRRRQAQSVGGTRRLSARRIEISAPLGQIRRMVTPAQIRAARGLLGLSQVWLARLAGISTRSSSIETARSNPKASTLAAIVKALEREGAEFTNGDEPGVKLRKGKAHPWSPDRQSADTHKFLRNYGLHQFMERNRVASSGHLGDNGGRGALASLAEMNLAAQTRPTYILRRWQRPFDILEARSCL